LFALIVIVVSILQLIVLNCISREKKTVKAGFHRSDIAFICYCRHSAFYYPYEIDFEVVSSSKSLALQP
jgi:hypothetical protein